MNKPMTETTITLTNRPTVADTLAAIEDHGSHVVLLLQWADAQQPLAQAFRWIGNCWVPGYVAQNADGTVRWQESNYGRDLNTAHFLAGLVKPSEGPVYCLEA
jgi:hypothetical protein